MAEQNQQQPIQQPRNIFELINMNIVEMSKDFVALYETVVSQARKIDEIHQALFQPISEPDAPGAEAEKD